MAESVPLSRYLAAQEQAFTLVTDSVQKEIARLLRYRVGPVDEAVERNADKALKQACGHISAFLAAVQNDREHAVLTMPMPGRGSNSRTTLSGMDGLTWQVQCQSVKDAAAEGIEWWRQLVKTGDPGEMEDEGKLVIPQAGRAALAMLAKRDKELDQRDSELLYLKKRLQLQGQHFYKELAVLREQMQGLLKTLPKSQSVEEFNYWLKNFVEEEFRVQGDDVPRREIFCENYVHLAEQAHKKGFQLDFEHYVDESTKMVVEHQKELLGAQYEKKITAMQKDFQQCLAESKSLRNQLKMLEANAQSNQGFEGQSIEELCKAEINLAVQTERERMETEKQQALKSQELEHEKAMLQLREQLRDSEELRKAISESIKTPPPEEKAVNDTETQGDGASAPHPSILMGQLTASQSAVSRQREEIKNLKRKVEDLEEKLQESETRETEHLEALTIKENEASAQTKEKAADQAGKSQMESEMTALKEEMQELRHKGVRELNRRRLAERKLEALEEKYRLAVRDLAAMSGRVSALKTPQDQGPELHALGPGPYAPAESYSSVSLSNTGKVFPKHPSGNHTVPRGPGLHPQSQGSKNKEASGADRATRSSESAQPQRPASARVLRPSSANSQRPVTAQRPMSARSAPQQSSSVSHNHSEELVEMLSVAGTGEALQRSAISYGKGPGGPPAELEPWSPGSERILFERQQQFERKTKNLAEKPFGASNWQPAAARPRPGSAKYKRP